MFIDMFYLKKGTPFFWKEKGAMLTQNEYNGKMIACRLDDANFSHMNQSEPDRVIVNKLVEKFEILFTIKDICVHLQSYSYKDHIELCVLAKEMATLELAISRSVEDSREV